MNFTIDLTFSHPPGDQLGVLGTEIENQYLVKRSLFLHRFELHVFEIGEGVKLKGTTIQSMF